MRNAAPCGELCLTQLGFAAIVFDDGKHPGAVVSPDEACLIRDALPAYQAARREEPDATLAAAVEAEGSDAGWVYDIDVPALVEGLRGLRPGASTSRRSSSSRSSWSATKD